MRKYSEAGIHFPAANRLRSLVLRQLYIDIATCLLAVRLAYSAVTGFLAPGLFHMRLSRYESWRMFADELVLTVPFTQAALVLLLALARTKQAGLYGSFAMMCFTFILPHSLRNGWNTLAVDLLLAGMAIAAAVLEGKLRAMRVRTA